MCVCVRDVPRRRQLHPELEADGVHLEAGRHALDRVQGLRGARLVDGGGVGLAPELVRRLHGGGERLERQLLAPDLHRPGVPVPREKNERRMRGE